MFPASPNLLSFYDHIIQYLTLLKLKSWSEFPRMFHFIKVENTFNFAKNIKSDQKIPKEAKDFWISQLIFVL